MRAPFLVIAAALLTAGCWSHDGWLYAEENAVTPLAAGTYAKRDISAGDVLETDKVVVVDGTYRVTEIPQPGDTDDPLTHDVRFFPLPGRANTYVYEATSVSCDAGVCDTSPVGARYFGLIEIDGTDIFRYDPDCKSTLDIAVKHGGKPGQDSSTCFFDNASDLEDALEDYLGSAAPDSRYTLEP